MDGLSESILFFVLVEIYSVLLWLFVRFVNGFIGLESIFIVFRNFGIIFGGVLIGSCVVMVCCDFVFMLYWMSFLVLILSMNKRLLCIRIFCGCCKLFSMIFVLFFVVFIILFVFFLVIRYVVLFIVILEGLFKLLVRVFMVLLRIESNWFVFCFVKKIVFLDVIVIL